MKNFYKIIVVVFLILNINIDAQSSQPSFQWAKRAGDYAFDYGYGTATDSIGNVYVAGKYEMNAYFGDSTVTCAGNHDIFVAKYDSIGNFKWVRTAGGLGGDYARAISCDGVGNIYLTGEMEMDCDFGSGIILHSNGNNDIFIAKYNTNGDLQWAKKVGGGPDTDRGYGIKQINGSIYVTGDFRQFAVFNGNINITSKGVLDMFIAKYTTEGVFQWVKTGGGTGDDGGYAISSDPAENIYVTGYFYDTANFSGTSIISEGGTDAFIAKYDSTGSLLWLKKAGGSDEDYGRGIIVGKLNSVFLTGEFRNISYFDTISLNSSGNADIFIANYNSSGDAIWARKAGGSLDDIGRAITVDTASNIYITGNFGGNADFGETNIIGADSTEIFFASYDVNGNFRWVLKADGIPETNFQAYPWTPEAGLSICTDRWSNVYASGDYRANSSFGSTTLHAWANADIFVTKIGINNTSIITDSQGLTDIAFVDMNLNKLNVYPNPTTGLFTIAISMAIINHKEKVKVRITNILGQEIFNKECIIKQNYIKETIELDKSLPSGIYTLQVIIGDKIENTTVVMSR